MSDITREEAIIELEDLKDYCNATFMRRTRDAYVNAINKGIDALENQKIGHWEDAGWRGDKCSVCGKDIPYREHKFNYCPNCGVKMKQEN